jgi:hypothetical protein
MTYKELHEELRQKINEDFGSRCKDFNINCMACQQYLALDILEENLDLEDIKR